MIAANHSQPVADRSRLGLSCQVGLLAIVLTTCAASAEPAAQQPPPSPQVVAQVREAIAGLDSATFSRRQAAAAQLDQLLDDQRLGGYLAAEFRRRLLAPDASLEVRARLEQYLKSLPTTPVPTTEPRATVEEIGPLLDQLDSDRSVERDTARRRLDAMPSQLELVAPLLLELKRRLADPGVNCKRVASWSRCWIRRARPGSTPTLRGSSCRR